MSGSPTMRAALLPAAGTPLRVVELELQPPMPGEVLVRLHASGVCQDDLNVLDGTVDVPSPLVPGHEGAGVVEALGEGVDHLAVGDHVALSWAPYCGICEECLRDLPHLCSTAWPMMLAGGLLDGTTRLRFGGAEVHHFCFLSSFAEKAVVPARSCVRIPAEVPFEVAALLGCAVTSGVCAVWRTAGVRPGERVAVIGTGGTGLSAVMGAVASGASQVVAVDRREERLERALELGATAVVPWRGEPEQVAEEVVRASGGGVDYAIECTGRPGPMRAAFLSTRKRGAAVMAGIPRADAEFSVPALSIPRMERRVLGSIYGSARPDRDFPLILDAYRRGRLPLERLISHRLTLDEVGTGVDAVRSGDATRVVIELGGDR
jgi:Zn-dependent alcohol dehydrogenase